MKHKRILKGERDFNFARLEVSGPSQKLGVQTANALIAERKTMVKIGIKAQM